jgi:RND family efflux transporter MFP subunit
MARRPPTQSLNTAKRPQQDMSARIGQKPKLGRLRLFGISAVLFAAAIVAVGLFWRHRDYSELRQWTQAQAIPTVEVIRPTSTDVDPELVLPGDVDAFYEAPIYSRVPGYLKQWYEDIGARVTAGQVLAEIDTPDLDQQLAQAQADLETAQANERLAKITAERWQSLLKRDAVARQDADEKEGDWQAKKALVAAAQANVGRLQAEESFKRIVAPFDGVVSTRSTDVGALINVGSMSGPPLFSVADTHEMRIYMRVPQYYTADLAAGMDAELRVPQYPNKVFPAKLVTTSNQIAKESRTLLVELHADNKDGKLSPGTYAEVHIKLPGNATVLRIPTSALVFREHGLEVAVIGSGNKVELKKISVGRDFGTEIEVVSGLAPTDQVIDSPPDSLAAGDTVGLAKAGPPESTPQRPAEAE